MLSYGEHGGGDRRMQVEMLVRVDVIERQPGRGEGGELCRHLGVQLAARGRIDEDTKRGARHVAAETPVRPD